MTPHPNPMTEMGRLLGELHRLTAPQCLVAAADRRAAELKQKGETK